MTDRPLEPPYPIVYLDALMVKMRQDGKLANGRCTPPIGMNMEGQKSVLGPMGKRNGEGLAKFWTSVLTISRIAGSFPSQEPLSSSYTFALLAFPVSISIAATAA